MRGLSLYPLIAVILGGLQFAGKIPYHQIEFPFQIFILRLKSFQSFVKFFKFPFVSPFYRFDFQPKFFWCSLFFIKFFSFNMTPLRCLQTLFIIGDNLVDFHLMFFVEFVAKFFFSFFKFFFLLWKHTFQQFTRLDKFVSFLLKIVFELPYINFIFFEFLVHGFAGDNLILVTLRIDYQFFLFSLKCLLQLFNVFVVFSNHVLSLSFEFCYGFLQHFFFAVKFTLRFF